MAERRKAQRRDKVPELRGKSTRRKADNSSISTEIQIDKIEKKIEQLEDERNMLSVQLNKLIDKLEQEEDEGICAYCIRDRNNPYSCWDSELCTCEPEDL